MKVCKLQVRQSSSDIFSGLFTYQDEICFCYNVSSLCNATRITCNPNKWYLFIDSSFGSLKADLLHNRNKYLTLALAHMVHLKEEYNNLLRSLEAWWVKLGGYQKLENGGIPDGSPKRFPQLSLSLGPQGHHRTLLQEALATTNQGFWSREEMSSVSQLGITRRWCFQHCT